MMTRERFPRSLGIKPLKFPGSDTPHATIETNRTCDIRCAACYNLNRTHVKTAAEIRAEIDLALSLRNLAMITLLGGEPTLHPALAEIAAYVKSKGVTCQILTNGLTILKDESGEYLAGLAAAGVDRIVLHVDSGQSHVHGDIEAARRALFAKLEAAGIRFSLSLTIYDGKQGEIPDLVRRYASYRHFDGVLAILARDTPPVKIQHPELAIEYDALERSLSVQPVAFIPSSLSDADVHWLIYFYFMDAETGEAFAFSPLAYRIFLQAHRIVAGRYLLNAAVPPRLTPLLAAAAGTGEVLLHPRRLRAFAAFLARAARPPRPGASLPPRLPGPPRLSRLRFHYIAIQAPPEFNERRGEYQLCYGCPDATIRNGRLTPVCVADRVSPPPGDTRAVDAALARAVYGPVREPDGLTA